MTLQVGELSALLDLDDGPFNRGINAAGDGVSRLGDTTKKVGVAVGAALVTAGAAAAAFGYKTVMAASDLNETMSKSSAVFKSAAGDIDTWSSGASKAFGMSKMEAADAASTFGNLFVQLGSGANEAAGMSKQMTQLAADFGSFHNASNPEVIEAMTAAFRGEYDAVQRYVPTISAATVAEEALRQTHKKSVDDLTAGEKALATQSLLMKGAGDAAGDFARTQDSLANRIKSAKAEAADFAANIGTKLLPVVLDAWDLFEKWAPAIRDRVGGAFKAANATVAPLVDNVRAFFAGAGNYSLAEAFHAGQAEEDMSKFQKTLAVTGGAFSKLTGPIDNAKAQWSLAREAFSMGSSGEDWFSVGPVEQAAETLGSIFGNIKEIAGEFFGTFNNYVTTHEQQINEWRSTISQIFGTIVEIITLAFQTIGIVFDVATGILTNAWDRFGKHLVDHLGVALDALLQVLSGAFNMIKGIFQIFIGVFTGDWSMAWEGVKNVFGGAWDVIVGVARFGINLVSTVIGAGMALISMVWGYAWNGIKAGFGLVWDGIVAYVKWYLGTLVDVFKGLGSMISGAASGAFDGVKNAFIGVINYILRKWNDLSFSIPGVDVPGVGKVGGATIDTPNIPLLARGGTAIGPGLAIVGDNGPELMAMNRGASIIPLPRGGDGAEGPTIIFESIEINGMRDADDVVRMLPKLTNAVAAGVGRKS